MSRPLKECRRRIRFIANENNWSPSLGIYPFQCGPKYCAKHGGPSECWLAASLTIHFKQTDFLAEKLRPFFGQPRRRDGHGTPKILSVLSIALYLLSDPRWEQRACVRAGQTLPICALTGPCCSRACRILSHTLHAVAGVCHREGECYQTRERGHATTNQSQPREHESIRSTRQEEPIASKGTRVKKQWVTSPWASYQRRFTHCKIRSGSGLFSIRTPRLIPAPPGRKSLAARGLSEDGHFQNPRAPKKRAC